MAGKRAKKRTCRWHGGCGVELIGRERLYCKEHARESTLAKHREKMRAHAKKRQESCVVNREAVGNTLVRWLLGGDGLRGLV